MPQDILLIVNPVSGRMKSKAGIFEILDELYRVDRPGQPLKEDARLPLTQAEAEAQADPIDPENPRLPFSESEAITESYGYASPQTLGGDHDPARRVTVVPTMYRGHATQLAADARLDGYDLVICCGGDGTLNETISGLLTIPVGSRPPLGYIPAGSTNDFAASLGLPSTLRGAARMAVGESEMPIDIGLFSPVGRDDLPRRLFSYIASFGIFTAASYSTPQSVKNALGHMAYVLEGVKDLANIEPQHASFRLDNGRVIEGDYIFGAVTNTTSAGGIFKLPAGSVSMSDGQFEVFLVHNPRTFTELSRLTAALLAADFEGCPLIEFYHTASVTIHLAHPLRWSLDGEEATGGRDIEIKCLPRAVKIKR